MTDADMLQNLTARLDAIDARLDRIEAQPAVQKPALTTLPAPAPKPATPTGNPGAAPFPMYWDSPVPPIAPMLADRFDRLRRLLPGANADGSQLSDADLLARAIDEIITLRTDAESAAWHDVATEPPPLRCNVLFANDYRIWVGEAREVTYCPSPGKDVTEITYYEDGDFSDGVPPVVWATLPVLDDPADPGLDAER